jgi:sulfonate transport system ATP-binding protein
VTAHVLRRLDVVAELSPGLREPFTGASGLSVTARWLEKSFGKKQVLRGINVHVPAGQFVAIVGRSGCGKSTLLRLLLNLDQPTGGEFWFGDREGKRTGPRAVRVMFQEPRLLPWASVLANVEVGLGEERRSPDARERALVALREVGLADRRDEWPSVLSGGQKQRVALARALVSRPRVLAFDEPLGALDALTRISMQRLLERVWLDQGFTAIMVTHDVAEAVTLADRVLLIEDGEIALDLRVDLPRPRERGTVEIAKLEGEILRHLFRNSHAGDDA